MKREDITTVFPDATKEQIDALLNIHSADIGKLKGDNDTLRGQLETANGTIGTLKDTVKQFDGVDVAALRKSVSDWEQKYNDDTAGEFRNAVLFCLTGVRYGLPQLLFKALAQ